MYIIIQFLLKAALTCFFQTRYFEQLIMFPLAVVDTSIYISTAHKFYLLLKERMHEARIHFFKRDYLNKKRIVTQFYFAQVCTLFIFSLLVFSTLLTFISVPLDILSHNPCYLSYIFLGYIPDMKIPKHIRKMFGLTGADPGLGKGGAPERAIVRAYLILTTVAVLYRRTGICNICTGIFSWDKIIDCV